MIEKKENAPIDKREIQGSRSGKEIDRKRKRDSKQRESRRQAEPATSTRRRKRTPNKQRDTD